MKSLFKTHLLIAICIAGLSLSAQTRPGSLKGTVTEDGSGQGAIGANIMIKDTAGNIIASGVTDFDGKYNINPVKAGKWQVQFSSIGFTTMLVKNVLISPNNPTVLNITLREASEMLSEVKVSFKPPLILKGKSSQIVTAEDIQNMAVRDVTSVAAQAAGVTTDATGNTRVRGARLEGTVYFIDGVRVRGNVDKSALLQLGYTVDSRAKADGEQYNSANEIPFKVVTSSPLSTFSSDVDVASYANIRRFLMDGYLPPKDAIRLEEMVNYFSYEYPAPKGEEKFGVLTETASCPWEPKHRLLRIGIQTEKPEATDLPPNNLVFLIDVSGSMNSSDKLPLLKKSLRMLVNQMRPEDRISIVVYASASGLVLEPTSGKKKAKILQALNGLSAGGSTAGGAGIELAYKTALENFKKNANNRVILATDGDFNVGVSSQSKLIKLIEKKRENGIFLTVLGFGTGNYQDGKMEQLANHGNGNFAYIDNLMEAQKVLVTEMGSSLHTVAKDTKFQIEFNPTEVLAYRLIGYENRILADEDFNDDTKDAGDVGSGHSVSAVYEIIPIGANLKNSSVPSIDSLKYQRTKTATAASSGELATLKLRYKEPDGKKSKLQVHVVKANAEVKHQEDFNFICAVLEVGMLLRDSEFAGKSTYEEALKLAKAGKGNDEFGYRGEFIRLTELAKTIDTEKKVGMN